MKIAILTFHRACNYGAVLQAYALQTSLNSLPGVEASILDYNSSGVYGIYGQFGMLKRKANILKSLVAEVLLFREIALRNRCFAAFRDKHFRIEQPDLKRQDLSRAAKDYDCIIVGSDQVWNPALTDHDNAFLLGFAPEGVKKYAYAASVGKSDLEKEELSAILEHLEGFETVSLREPTFLEMFRQNLAGIEVREDVDPVFLLSAEQWRAFSRKENRDPYVLYFTLGGGKDTDQAAVFARRMARELGVRVVYASSDHRWYAFRDMEHAGTVSPEELVGLIDGARCVVTNSFHATAFSIILHTPFFVDMGAAFNGRIQNLLDLTGLADRTIQNAESSETTKGIDWDPVDARLAQAGAESKAYLRKIAEQKDYGV